MLRSRTLWRLLAVSLVGALVLLQPGPVGAGGSPGRDYSRCIKCCNHHRQKCEDACRDWCAWEYPNDSDSYGECLSECVAICIEESKECKLACEVLKPGHSPEEP